MRIWEAKIYHFKMKKHTRIYFKAFNVEFDPVSGWHDCRSEINGKKASDIHHILNKGMGGTTENLDRIENLMALTRLQHDEWGDKKNLIWNLFSIHRQHMRENGVDFDNDWIEEQMAKYAYEKNP